MGEKGSIEREDLPVAVSGEDATELRNLLLVFIGDAEFCGGDEKEENGVDEGSEENEAIQTTRDVDEVVLNMIHRLRYE